MKTVEEMRNELIEICCGKSYRECRLFGVCGDFPAPPRFSSNAEIERFYAEAVRTGAINEGG